MQRKRVNEPEQYPQHRTLLISLERLEKSPQLSSVKITRRIHDESADRVFPSIVRCIELESQRWIEIEKQQTEEITGEFSILETRTVLITYCADQTILQEQTQRKGIFWGFDNIHEGIENS